MSDGCGRRRFLPWGSLGSRRRGSPWASDRENPEATGPARLLALLIWGVFIFAPVVDAVTNRGSGAGHVLAIAGALAFSGLYVWVVVTW